MAKAKPAEPIVLEDIVLYDAQGKPAVTYKKVTLDGEAVKNSTSQYLLKNQDDWMTYFSSLNDGRTLPSLPLYYAIIERLQEAECLFAPGLLNDLQEDWLCTSTRINYAEKTITHGYGFEPHSIKCYIPAGNVWVDEVKNNKGWRSALQSLFMPKDLKRVIETLEGFNGGSPFIWTPGIGSRKSSPARALWLGLNAERFDFFADSSLENVGHSYGIRLEK